MTHRYHINLFWSDADTAWIADVPDLAGCSAWGATPEAALHEVEIAISEWIAVATDDAKVIPPARYSPAIYAVTRAA